MLYIALINTDFCLLFDLSGTQYPEILWQFYSQASLWQGKKTPSDSQKCTTSVFAPFASSFTYLLNSSGLIKSPWVRALAPLPQSFVSQLLSTHWSDPNAKMELPANREMVWAEDTAYLSCRKCGNGTECAKLLLRGSPSSSEIYLFQERIAKKWKGNRERNAVTLPFSCWTG